MLELLSINFFNLYPKWSLPGHLRYRNQDQLTYLEFLFKEKFWYACVDSHRKEHQHQENSCNCQYHLEGSAIFFIKWEPMSPYTVGSEGNTWNCYSDQYKQYNYQRDLFTEYFANLFSFSATILSINLKLNRVFAHFTGNSRLDRLSLFSLRFGWEWRMNPTFEAFLMDKFYTSRTLAGADHFLIFIFSIGLQTDSTLSRRRGELIACGNGFNGHGNKTGVIGFAAISVIGWVNHLNLFW